MQKRTTKKQKKEIVKRYLAGENATDIAPDYKITNVAILGLLHRRNVKIRSQSQIQRKYLINETYFDDINTQKKAYFLGFLYADGYNNINRNSVTLGLIEKDKEILIKLNNLLQSKKPLQYVELKKGNQQNQYRLVIANKHISKKLSELGCVQAKTYILEFPEWLNNNLYSHFIRGYFDGDGWVGKKSICIVSTEKFCKKLESIFNKKLKINCYLRTRHPERRKNIRMLEISGGKQVRTFLNWIYNNSKIHLERKYKLYQEHLEYEKKLKEERKCSVIGCERKYMGKGYCKKHYYQFCGGKEKRRERYLQTGK